MHPYAVTPHGVPDDLMLVPAVAHEFGLSSPAVRMAILEGRLPAVRLAGGGRNRRTFAVRRCDAELLWGEKKEKSLT